MLYREMIAVCSQIHTKHINTLCGQNVEFLIVKPGRTDTVEGKVQIHLVRSSVLEESGQSAPRFFRFSRSKDPVHLVHKCGTHTHIYVYIKPLKC